MQITMTELRVSRVPLPVNGRVEIIGADGKGRPELAVPTAEYLVVMDDGLEPTMVASEEAVTYEAVVSPYTGSVAVVVPGLYSEEPLG
jgi:hypothetical protein